MKGWRDVQLWDSFQHSGFVGKAVLFILLAFSFISWAIIAIVAIRFSQVGKASRQFLDTFRRSRRLSEAKSASSDTSHSPLVGLFRAGYAEIEDQVELSGGTNQIRSIESVERSLQRATRLEATRLTKNLQFLATTAAATPFIGLFGTVWGIMGAFRNIGTTGSASIVAVAPGISEALINTAAGLFAAIPALMAYNYFVSRVRESRGEMDDFSLEFLNLTDRNFVRRA